MTGESERDRLDPAPRHRRRRHANPQRQAIELAAQANDVMGRLARRVERLTGHRPDWNAHIENFDTLVRVAARRNERIRTFGIAGFVPHTAATTDRTIAKIHVVRIGAAMDRPLINESRDLHTDPTQLTYRPFLTVSEGLIDMVEPDMWIDLRTWNIAGSIDGYVQDIDAHLRLWPRVGLTDLHGHPIRPDGSNSREAISASTARIWGWTPGAICPVTFVLCRRETDDVAQMEIVRTRSPW